MRNFKTLLPHMYFILLQFVKALKQNMCAARSSVTVRTRCAVWITDAEANLIILFMTHRLLNYNRASVSRLRLFQTAMHDCMLLNMHIHAVRFGSTANESC